MKTLEQKKVKESKLPVKEHKGSASVSHPPQPNLYNKKGEKLILKHCKECDKIGRTCKTKWKSSRETMQNCWRRRKISRNPQIYFKKGTNSFVRALQSPKHNTILYLSHGKNGITFTEVQSKPFNGSNKSLKMQSLLTLGFQKSRGTIGNSSSKWKAS